MHVRGLHVPQNYSAARHHFLQAAAKQLPSAINGLGGCPPPGSLVAALPPSASVATCRRQPPCLCRLRPPPLRLQSTCLQAGRAFTACLPGLCQSRWTRTYARAACAHAAGLQCLCSAARGSIHRPRPPASAPVPAPSRGAALPRPGCAGQLQRGGALLCHGRRPRPRRRLQPGHSVPGRGRRLGCPGGGGLPWATTWGVALGMALSPDGSSRREHEAPAACPGCRCKVVQLSRDKGVLPAIPARCPSRPACAGRLWRAV